MIKSVIILFSHEYTCLMSSWLSINWKHYLHVYELSSNLGGGTYLRILVSFHVCIQLCFTLLVFFLDLSHFTSYSIVEVTILLAFLYTAAYQSHEYKFAQQRLSCV